jgi:hypothetical protein
VQIKFEHDVGAMGFGGVDGDAEERGDFFIGLTLGEELEDLAFTRSEPGARMFGSFGRSDGGIIGGDSGNASGEVGFVLAYGIDGGEENAVGIIFEDVTTRAGLNDLLNEIVGFVHGQDKDFGIGGRGTNAASGFDSVEQGHADIQDSDVGLEFGGFVYGIAAVGSFGGDFPAGTGFEESTESGANDGMVVSDQDA